MAATGIGRAVGQPLVLDANICYPALRGGILAQLGRLGRLCTTDVVVDDELIPGRTYGPEARTVLDEAGVDVVTVDFDPDDYGFLSKSLADADISCFVLAKELDGMVMTHDRRLAKDCDNHSVQVRRLAWLLTLALDAGHLSAADVRHALRLWRHDPDEQGWYDEPDMLEVEDRCR